MWARVAPELPQESGGLGPASPSGCSRRASLTSGMCVWRWGRRPVGLCVRWGRAGPGTLRSRGPGPGAWLPPDPRLLGLRSPVLGAGYMQGSVPPNGLDPVRKEINKKGGEGGRGVRTAWAVQSRPGAQATEANPGHARAGVRVSLGLGPRYRGLRGPR